MNICVVGDLDDLTLIYVAHRAKARGLNVLELSESALGTDWDFAFDDGNTADGTISVEGQEYSFAEIAGLYVRLSSEPDLPPALGDLAGMESAVLIRERRSALQYLLNCFPGPVANRPAAGRSNGSKPFQMRRLEQAGFAVPPWIASNDLEAIDRFAGRFADGVVYKSCSGLRAQARLLDEAIRERLRQGTTPVVVQQYVAGADVRVHTVNGRPFATRIVSDEVDYRFAETESTYEPIDLPATIGPLCAQMAEMEGLTIAGFDFRVTASGQWTCLEVNPVPTFLPYEMLAEQPIADAVLDALVGRGDGPKTASSQKQRARALDQEAWSGAVK